MAPINILQRAVEAPMTTTLPASTPYPAAIGIAIASSLVILLMLPPMFWHYRNRNLSATFLVAWSILINLLTLINAVIWPNDDIPNWYDGAGFCDVETKFLVAYSVGGPAALAGVLRSLANAMDTSRVRMSQSKAQKWKSYAIDLSLCIGFPALQMLFLWIVQRRRYVVYGIMGCGVDVSSTWLSVLLMWIPPMIWTLVGAFYAVVVIVRLCRYKMSFASILASSNMPKARFLRLYIFCIAMILGFVSSQTYNLYVNLAILAPHLEPFKWNVVHDPATWNNIELLPSNGHVFFTVYLWLASGIVIFFFFGMGKDAMSVYRSSLRAVGFAKIWPSLDPEYTPRHSRSGTAGSFSSKAKLMFKRKSSISSWYTDSKTSQSESVDEPISPRNLTFLDAIKEDYEGKGAPKSRTWMAGDVEKATAATHQPSIGRRLAAMFSRGQRAPSTGTPLADLSGQQVTVQSRVATSLSSPVMQNHSHAASLEVIVRKEVRQDSERAEAVL